jgi:NADH:ubiquinone oxidoreductase subunit 6 (subunit J)
MGFWEPLFFWIFAVGAVVTSLGVLTFRNPLYSALSLIADFFCFAALYALLSAHFMAITQVLVYAGAIMVLFVFIIMLLNLTDAELGERQFSLHHILAWVGGIAIFVFSASTFLALIPTEDVNNQRAEAKESGEAVATMSTVPGLYADLSESALEARYREKIKSWAQGDSTPADGKYRPFLPDRTYTIPPALEHAAGQQDTAPASRSAEKKDGLFGTVEPVSILLVNRFVVPFELTAILLLAAIIGAVIIAKKRL